MCAMCMSVFLLFFQNKQMKKNNKVSKKFQILCEAFVFFTLKMLFILLCCCVAALCQDVLGEGEFYIRNASDLIEFSKNVNNGTGYSGATVFLDADINFSGGLSEVV